MKEKKWVDCPCCGSKGTMKIKSGIHETYRLQGYKPIRIGPLEGSFCSICREGFYTLKSEKFIHSRVAEEKAKQDSDRIVASEILEIEDVVKKLHVTRQRVHQMMKEGKLKYVYVGKTRMPLKDNDFKTSRRHMQG
jgi:hypothetical protein